MDESGNQFREIGRDATVLSMKANEIKLRFATADLGRTHEFYSIAGIKWGDDDWQLGESGLPTHVEQHPELGSLPHLWGTVDNIELLFYFDREKQPSQDKASAILMFYFEDDAAVTKALDALEGKDLFHPAPDFDRKFNRMVMDPDGRYVELCAPHPFRV